MKILHILDHSIPLHSGYTFRTRAIFEQQRKMGWETAHVTGIKHVANCPDEEVIDGFHFYRTHPSESIFSGLPVLNQIDVVSTLTKRLSKVIKKEKPDILHAHSPSLNGIAALKARKKYGLPVVYECRAFWEDAAVDHGTSREWGLRYRLTRALESYVFRSADAIVTICEGLKEEIISRGLSREKITVIPNAVDTARFQYDQKKNEALESSLGLEGKSVLGFIGSFYAYEGLTLLLESLGKIVPENNDVRLLLVGGGPQEDELAKLVKKLQISEYVIFVGRVPHKDVADYYALIDILVYARTNMRLTDLVTPLKPLEAMAQGKLVLASDVGGHKELIQNGYNGVLFEAGNSDDLVRSVSNMLNNREDWPTLRENGRKFVEKERNWPASVSHYMPVYESLI